MISLTILGQRLKGYMAGALTHPSVLSFIALMVVIGAAQIRQRTVKYVVYPIHSIDTI